MIGLDNAADLFILRQRDVKAPVAIPLRYWAGNAATGQLVKPASGDSTSAGPPSGLFSGNGLLEIQPNNVARIGAVGRHLPCLVAALGTPIDLFGNVVLGLSAEQFVECIKLGLRAGLTMGRKSSLTLMMSASAFRMRTATPLPHLRNSTISSM